MATTKKRKPLNLGIIIVIFLISYVIGGYTLPVLMSSYSKSKKSESSPIPLPKDLVKISGCIPFEGEHWVSPKNVDHGPYYVIYNGKLLGFEYMFAPEDIAGEKYSTMSPEDLMKYMQTNNMDFSDVVNDIRSFNFDTFDANIKYVDLHWTAPHAGSVHPHYDMHLYLVEKSEMDTVCPDSTFNDVINEGLIQDLIKEGIPLPGAPH